ncbi:helix-turn-helix domain-containing protein [Paenibacillus peoriae]|uniref:helix-turn-helix domain-containing protein n=1 Tax=Paenibacillus TaxID=44249 RepID=UPI0008FC5DD1|nr:MULTISPECIES: helix-turn-helix domain-containing protein [Paenibacillus]APB72264.1 helix-turn-helix domain-containing protein [Paenibacillus polymyxa]PPQ48105.1 helix-turn-helix domain-containing protein [Paenibacillus peoriae]
MEQPAFGTYLKQQREHKQWSINQLADAAGISNSQISRIENGLRGIPKPSTLRKIADALSVSYTEMMKAAGYWGDDDSMEQNPHELYRSTVPEWATSKDRRDFKKMLEEDDELMFDGIPLDEKDRQRIKDVLTGLFWEAKQMNKHKMPKEPRAGKDQG